MLFFLVTYTSPAEDGDLVLDGPDAVADGGEEDEEDDDDDGDDDVLLDHLCGWKGVVGWWEDGGGVEGFVEVGGCGGLVSVVLGGGGVGICEWKGWFGCGS